MRARVDHDAREKRTRCKPLISRTSARKSSRTSSSANTLGRSEPPAPSRRSSSRSASAMASPLLSPRRTRRTFGARTPCVFKYTSIASTFEFLVITNARASCEVSKPTKSASRDLSSHARRNPAGSSSRKFFGSGDAPAFVAHIVRSKSKKTQVGTCKATGVGYGDPG